FKRSTKLNYGPISRELLTEARQIAIKECKFRACSLMIDAAALELAKYAGRCFMKARILSLTIPFFAAGFAFFCAASPSMRRAADKNNSVKLNREAFEHCQELITHGQVVVDKKGLWSEHQPSAEKENEFIRLHGFDEYAKWYL